MECPTCGQDTAVTRTRAGDRPHTIRRTRVCKNPAGSHSFDTQEELFFSGLKDVYVVKGSGTDRSSEPFSVEQLEGDLQRALLKGYPPELIPGLVLSVVRSLELNLATRTIEVEPHWAANSPATRPSAAVLSSTIAEEVLAVLKLDRTRKPAHVLFALSVFGHRHRDVQQRWSTGTDIVRWMNANDSKLQESAPSIPEFPEPTGETWVYPQALPSLPTRVIKRPELGRTAGQSASESDDPTRVGRGEDFVLSQFVGSIELVLHGRCEAAELDYVAEAVAMWTLAGLVGQTTVLTSQLTAGVQECLRRVDQIASMRWSYLAKRFWDISDVYAEALGLANQPSAPLTFIRPRPRPTARPTSSAAQEEDGQ